MRRRLATWVWLAIALSGAAACREQTRAEAVKILCDVPIDCPECVDALDGQEGERFGEHLKRRISNDEAALILIENGKTKSPRPLRIAAQEAGLESCALADYLGRPIEVEPPGTPPSPVRP